LQSLSDAGTALYELNSHSLSHIILLYRNRTECTERVEKIRGSSLGLDLPIKQTIKRRFTVPPQITCASALPGKTGKHENCIFHSNAVLVHCQNSTSRCLMSSIFLTQDSYAADDSLPNQVRLVSH